MSCNKKYYVTDKKTGEIINYKFVLTEEQSEIIDEKKKNEKALMYGKNRKFAHVKNDPIRALMKKISFTEAGAFIKLLPYIHYNNNTLTFVREGKTLKQSDIQKVIGRGETATKNIMRKLINNNVIKKEKEGRSNIFIVNDSFAYIGKMKNKKDMFTRLYLVPIKKMSHNLSLEELGFLYFIFPYFHPTTYTLCSNPQVESRKDIDFLSQEGLAKVLDITPQSVINLFKKLNDKGFIMFVKVYGKKSYILNPKIASRLHPRHEINSPDYTVVTELFDNHKRQVEMEMEQLENGKGRLEW